MVQNVRMNLYFDISSKIQICQNVTYDIIAFSSRNDISLLILLFSEL